MKSTNPRITLSWNTSTLNHLHLCRRCVLTHETVLSLGTFMIYDYQTFGRINDIYIYISSRPIFAKGQEIVSCGVFTFFYHSSLTFSFYFLHLHFYPSQIPSSFPPPTDVTRKESNIFFVPIKSLHFLFPSISFSFKFYT